MGGAAQVRWRRLPKRHLIPDHCLFFRPSRFQSVVRSFFRVGQFLSTPPCDDCRMNRTQKFTESPAIAPQVPTLLVGQAYLPGKSNPQRVNVVARPAGPCFARTAAFRRSYAFPAQTRIHRNVKPPVLRIRPSLYIADCYACWKGAFTTQISVDMHVT
jgi:hypothetical protein